MCVSVCVWGSGPAVPIIRLDHLNFLCAFKKPNKHSGVSAPVVDRIKTEPPIKRCLTSS